MQVTGDAKILRKTGEGQKCGQDEVGSWGADALNNHQYFKFNLFTLDYRLPQDQPLYPNIWREHKPVEVLIILFVTFVVN